MKATSTDALVVMRAGRIVAEYYADPGAMAPHIVFSVSKSITGLLAGIAMDDGRLDPEALVIRYVPEVEGSAFADRSDLSIRDLADEPFIGFRRHLSPRYFDDTQAAFHKAGLEPRIMAEMGTEADMLALVGSGMGIAFVNSAPAWRPPHSVRFVKVADFEVGLQLCFVHLRENKSPTVAHLADIAGAIPTPD